jgi:1-acyl-sn-glycerol-3-phosphate acyltransferase
MIPVDRERRSSALRSLEKAAGQVRTGRPVLFFAEGTRSADGRLQPFKRGAFVIALKAGVPIVPVSVSGGHEVLPKSSLRIRPGRIVVRYGPPIPIDGYTLRTRDQLIARVHEAVRAGILENEAAAPPA